MSADKKKIMLAVYIDEKLKNDLEKLAEKRYISMSSLVVSFIAAEVKEARKNKEIR